MMNKERLTYSTIGNKDLLDRPLIAVLASRTINPTSVMPALDWATEKAQNPNVTIISGFQSTIEKKILRYLLDGKCGIVLVLARSMYKSIPDEYQQPIADGRMLLLSLTDYSQTVRSTALRRNHFIADRAEQLLFISLNAQSSLMALYESYHEKKYIELL